MKKLVLLLLIITSVFLSGCDKDTDGEIISEEETNELLETKVDEDTNKETNDDLRTDISYDNWMKDTIKNDDLVVDISMIGAHDAFSNEIDMDSEVDYYLNEDIFTGFSGRLLKSVLVNESKTQTYDVETLLHNGVRYFDVRLSYYEENWYTKHNYISSDFKDICEDIVTYLSSVNGEFLILDVQHIDGISYSNEEDYILFKEMLENYGILEYAYIVEDLGTLTYGELTSNGTKSRVLITSKFTSSEGKILNYQNSVRSEWANSDDFADILDFLENESNLAASLSSKLRVMQAVTTMQLSVSGISNGVSYGSLIERANDFNDYLINYDNFEDLLVHLPIVMIDNACLEDFNEKLMNIIIEYNNTEKQ